MLELIKKLLQKVIDNIDAGNSNITESEGIEIISYLRKLNDIKLSKYQACDYLNVSRATFDNLVRDGKIPKGIKQAGFKELFWYKEDLKNYITSHK